MANRYWVGNGGNWSSTSHWSTSSGGTSGASVPSSSDSVFFDANSFSTTGQTVVVDTTAYCVDMNWTGATNNPTMSGTGNIYHYGSWTLISAMTFTWSGILRLWGTGGSQTVTMAGKQLGANSSFNAVGGVWTLQDNFDCGSFNTGLNQGTLNVNGKTLTCTTFDSDYANTRTLNLTNSTLNISGDFLISGANMTFTSTGSTINMLGTGSMALGGRTFNAVNCKGSTTISGSNTFATLSIDADKTCTLTAGTTQTITSNLVSNGTSGHLATLVSSVAGSTATISKSSGTINVSYMYLKDSTASGGATFNITNSQVVSNISGWIFDHYWVGGTGNWNDASHWAGYNGGSGGTSVPTQNDNVYFNANSFSAGSQTITINATASCNTMDWTGVTNSPTLAGASALSVYGSLILHSSITLSWNAVLNFKGTSPSPYYTVDLAGKTLNNSCVFNASAGIWSLSSNLNVGTQLLQFLNGKLYFNAKTVTCGNFDTDTSGARTLDMVSATLNCTGYCDMQGNNLTYDFTGSTINMSGGGAFYGGGRTFNIVNIKSNTTMLNSSTFGTLSIDAGKTLTVTASSTQTITTNFISNGVSGNLAVINSSVNGTSYTISKSSGTLDVYFLSIRDCTASGGATFNCWNGTNVTHNSGWNFLYKRYWVGGTGNWSSTSHWSDTSGGANLRSVPDSSTYVYFDANSFSSGSQTVTLDSVSCYCIDMDWTGSTNSPTMAGTGNLYCYGNFKLISDMTFTWSGILRFWGTGNNQTVTMAGKQLNGSSSFNAVGGVWILQDDFNCGSYDTGLNQGTLNTNGKTVTCNIFDSDFDNVRTLTISNSTFNIASDWLVSGVSNLTITTTSSVINMTGTNKTFSAGGKTYGTLNVNGSVTIVGSNTFNTLSIGADKTCKFTAGTTQTVTNFVSNGTAGHLATLSSSSAGSSATLSKASGFVRVSYMSIKDNSASGGAVFIATKSTMVSGYSGWNFDHYWVGNGGNWNDSSHWSASSGGGSGASVPTQYDNVYFDASSFSSGGVVTINASAICYDMDWTGVTNNPTLTGSSYDLNIYGSMILSNMTYSHSANLSFRTVDSGKTITTNGVVIGSVIAVYFDASTSGGDITLLDDFNCGSRFIDLRTMALNTNGKTVTCGLFKTMFTFTRSLTLGASIINVSGDFSLASDVALNAGTSTIKMSGNSSVFTGYGKTFYNLECSGSPVTIASSNTFNDIKGTAGKIIRFTSGTTQTINNLSGNGTAENLIYIDSTSAGSPATLSKPSGSINVSYYNIKDSTASGGATFTANNSTSVSGNTGWLFPIAITSVVTNSSLSLVTPVILGSANVVSFPSDLSVVFVEPSMNTNASVNALVANTSVNFVIPNISGNLNVVSFATNSNINFVAPVILTGTSVNVSSVVASVSTNFISPVTSGTANVNSVVTNSNISFVAPTISAVKNVNISSIVTNTNTNFVIPVISCGANIVSVVTNTNLNFIAPSISQNTNVIVVATVTNTNINFVAPIISAYANISSVVTNSNTIFNVPNVTGVANVQSLVTNTNTSFIAPVISIHKTANSVVANSNINAISPVVSTFTDINIVSVSTNASASFVSPVISAIKNVNINSIVTNSNSSFIAPIVTIPASVTSVTATSSCRMRQYLSVTVDGKSFIDCYSESNYDSYTLMNSKDVYQSFFNLESTNINSCKWYLRGFGSPTGNLVAKLYAHSGTYGVNGVPIGSPLAVSDVVTASVLSSSNFSLVEFVFSTKYKMNANTNYCIVLSSSVASQLFASDNVYVSDNLFVQDMSDVEVGYDSTSSTHGGNFGDDFNGAWTPNSNDAVFYVFGDVIQGTEVDSIVSTVDELMNPPSIVSSANITSIVTNSSLVARIPTVGIDINKVAVVARYNTDMIAPVVSGKANVISVVATVNVSANAPSMLSVKNAVISSVVSASTSSMIIPVVSGSANIVSMQSIVNINAVAPVVSGSADVLLIVTNTNIDAITPSVYMDVNIQAVATNTNTVFRTPLLSSGINGYIVTPQIISNIDMINPTIYSDDTINLVVSDSISDFVIPVVSGNADIFVGYGYSIAEFTSPDISGDAKVDDVVSDLLSDFIVPTVYINADINVLYTNSSINFIAPSVNSTADVQAIVADSLINFKSPLLSSGTNANIDSIASNYTTDFINPVVYGDADIYVIAFYAETNFVNPSISTGININSLSASEISDFIVPSIICDVDIQPIATDSTIDFLPPTIMALDYENILSGFATSDCSMMNPMISADSNVNDIVANADANAESNITFSYDYVIVLLAMLAVAGMNNPAVSTDTNNIAVLANADCDGENNIRIYTGNEYVAYNNFRTAMFNNKLEKFDRTEPVESDSYNAYKAIKRVL